MPKAKATPTAKHHARARKMLDQARSQNPDEQQAAQESLADLLASLPDDANAGLDESAE